MFVWNLDETIMTPLIIVIIKLCLVREEKYYLLLLYICFLKGMFKTTKHFVEEDFSGTKSTKSKRKRSPSYRMQFKASLSKQFLCTGLKLCFILLMSTLKGKSVPRLSTTPWRRVTEVEAKLHSHFYIRQQLQVSDQLHVPVASVPRKVFRWKFGGLS
jgi:hypothetical protein